jgi:hypothetical protein
LQINLPPPRRPGRILANTAGTDFRPLSAIGSGISGYLFMGAFTIDISLIRWAVAILIDRDEERSMVTGILYIKSEITCPDTGAEFTAS